MSKRNLMSCRAWRLGFVLAGAFFLGCQTGTPMVPVSGTVRLDDQDIPEGDIILIDLEGRLGPDAGKIEDGDFYFLAKPGHKKVEIRASQKVPGKGAQGEDFIYQSYIPSRYNDQSTLSIEISPDKTNHREFNLKSAP